MKLAYALLAMNAGRLQDGKLCIWGADIDTVLVDSVPAQVSFTVVAKFHLYPDEPLEGHTFQFDLTRLGERKQIAEPMPLNTKRNTLDNDEPSGASVLVHTACEISAVGKHAIHVLVDGHEVTALPFYVRNIKEIE